MSRSHAQSVEPGKTKLALVVDFDTADPSLSSRGDLADHTEKGRDAAKANGSTTPESPVGSTEASNGGLAADLPDDPGALLLLARAAYKASDWREADRLCAALLTLAPTNVDAVLLRARSAARLKNWEDAARFWAVVCAERPEWAEGWFQLARVRVKRGDAAGARAAVEPLVALRDESVETLSHKFRALTQIGNPSRATDIMARLNAADPAKALEEYEYALAHKLPRAMAIALRVLKGRADLPGDASKQAADTVNGLSLSAARNERSGALEEAYADYSALIQLDASESAERGRERIMRVLWVMANDSLQADNLVDGCKIFRRLLACNPDDKQALMKFGRALMRLKEWDEAIAVWAQLQRFNPTMVEACVQLARATDRSRELDKTIAHWEAVKRLEPDHPEATAALEKIVGRMMSVGGGAMKEENFKAAWRMFKGVLQREPGHERALERRNQVAKKVLKRMRAAYKGGDMNGVALFSDEAAELLPERAEARRLLARSFMQLRRYEEAVGEWRALARLDEEQRLRATTQLMRCLLRLRRFDEAGAVARDLLALDPGNAEAVQVLADL